MEYVRRTRTGTHRKTTHALANTHPWPRPPGGPAPRRLARPASPRPRACSVEAVSPPTHAARLHPPCAAADSPQQKRRRCLAGQRWAVPRNCSRHPFASCSPGHVGPYHGGGRRQARRRRVCRRSRRRRFCRRSTPPSSGLGGGWQRRRRRCRPGTAPSAGQRKSLLYIMWRGGTPATEFPRLPPQQKTRSRGGGSGCCGQGSSSASRPLCWIGRRRFNIWPPPPPRRRHRRWQRWWWWQR